MFLAFDCKTENSTIREPRQLMDEIGADNEMGGRVGRQNVRVQTFGHKILTLWVWHTIQFAVKCVITSI